MNFKVMIIDFLVYAHDYYFLNNCFSSQVNNRWPSFFRLCLQQDCENVLLFLMCKLNYEFTA